MRTALHCELPLSEPPLCTGAAPAGNEDALYAETINAIRWVLVSFLESSLGEPVDEEFSNRTPFMDAGLDSLDLMKVRQNSACFLCPRCRIWALNTGIRVASDFVLTSWMHEA